MLGAMQEVPFAAHGQEFSFVLGLLDQKNSHLNLAVTTIENTSPLSVKETSENCEINTIQSYPQSFSNKIIKKSTNSLLKKKGAIIQMDINNGISTIKSCMEAARKRTVGRMGRCHIKSVTAQGCRDFGME